MMWWLLGVVIICFTIIVLFRMFLDLRRNELQHVRMTQNDSRNYDKYQAVTQQEAIQKVAEMLKGLPQGNYLPELPPARYHQSDELPEMIHYKTAKLDPSLMTGEQIDRLRKQDFERFMMQRKHRQ